jgi:ATP-dependent helicase Lhr and Lhr-like helicase
VTGQLDPGFASDLLSTLEDFELPLLSWGVTNGTLAHDEVLEIIVRQIAAHSAQRGYIESPELVLQRLLRAALLFRVPGSSPPRYRTRLAETVRLLARLRQLFGPQDLTQPPARWWDRGRPLVADYRLHTAPRRYPSREIPVGDALDELQHIPGWQQLHTDIAAAQIGGLDLARFQLDASRSILESLYGAQGRGVIVGAGTGSGKTLAFYLPAFAAMAQRATPGRFGLHTLALYPRKELLRDQLRTAVATSLAVANALEKAGMRRIRIGALYGDTPANAADRRLTGNDPRSAWRSRGADLVCPYLSCPVCDKDLIWPQADRARGRDRVLCTGCGLVLDGDLALTRESLQARPPDLLFTTTEMLNRNASSPGLGRLLGWRGATAPALVLLDEVHTYSGLHGAQVALLLRRWRNDLRNRPTFVGLSATLRDAAAFFGQLTGLDQTLIDYIEPRAADLEIEGREYALAVRGDPVAGASLLATSIQAAMLFGRTLDPPGREYLHGSRGFLFTDDLDVTNRFYDDLRDAEGGHGRARRGGPRGRVLAGLRSPDAPYSADRYLDGQSWDLIQRIGRPLDALASAGDLRIGRTSSQDVGVDRDADLVVATASLEVGYDDPRVGLVLQHKAPHDPAAFIQRRGRAGRVRGTRPWTVITLSDYGRDRLAYQAYDTLFAPDIPPRRLPTGNRFVLKIQGTQALLDWLGARMAAAGHPGDPRELLTAPVGTRRPEPAKTEALTGLLQALLGDPGLQDDLAQHLRRALAISGDEAQALLWEQPRALLLVVVPTALRRLRSDWRPVTRDPGASTGALLPEFLTAALFDPLNVPEVALELPFAADTETLSIEKALREAVPGRVSRRYGYRRGDQRTWLPLPPAAVGGAIDVTGIAPAYSREGNWAPPGQPGVEVVRPYIIRLADPPREVSDQAQGIPVWESQIIQPPAGLYRADIPDPSAWSGRAVSAGFATHAAGNPAEVRRMTTGAECETLYENGRTVASTVRYVLDGAPAALGFRLTADAARFDLAPLDLSKDTVAAHLRSPAWRTFAFTARISQDPGLDRIANSFQRGWLTLVYLTAFALGGLDGTAPERIHTALANGAWSANLRAILQVLYRDARPGGPAAPERLITALTTLSQDQAVTGCLDRHGTLLWAGDTAGRTADLAQRAYRDTVAAALLAAALRACPDAQDRDLIADVVPAPADTEPAAIWLTETSGGGLGLIEQLARFYAEDPRRFWGLVDSALGPGDHEHTDAALCRFLDRVVSTPDGPVATAMQRLREAPSAREADLALQQLLSAWADLDGYPRQPAVSALSARLLRPGSSRATDATALAIIRAWDGLQDRLGFEIDARVIAYAVGSGRLTVPGMAASPSADQVFSMLWPRGSQARSQHLQHYQPYAGPPSIDRLLAAAAHDEGLPVVDITQADWQARYTTVLARDGAVILTAPAVQAEALSQAIRVVPAIGVDRDVLRVYGEVRKFLRSGDYLHAHIDVREAAQ